MAVVKYASALLRVRPVVISYSGGDIPSVINRLIRLGICLEVSAV
jgi:hypothetical protein